MANPFERTELLLGKDCIEKLTKCHVIIFGIGGVGGYVVEALVRSGIGAIDIVDNDKICTSNINRQIYATTKTVGLYKVDVAKQRILEINPEIKVNTFQTFYCAQNANEFDFSKYDYIVDAIDTVSAKLSLIEEAKKYNVPIICAMGAGNKMNPTEFEVADISQTSVCPLARVIRTELKKRNIKNVKVVYSKEKPIKPLTKNENNSKPIPASNAFVPSVVGFIIASEVVKDLIEYKN